MYIYICVCVCVFQFNIYNIMHSLCLAMKVSNLLILIRSYQEHRALPTMSKYITMTPVTTTGITPCDQENGCVLPFAL